MNKNLINFFLLLLAVALVAFGIVVYVLLKLPLTVYLILLSVLALVVSLYALRKCGCYARLEGMNYENYKELRNRIEELEGRE
jgi:membrane protein implicated in regulation of membrane protease activity